VHTRSIAARFTFVFGVILLAGVHKLEAQATDGNLVGTVVDQTGASIPLATVETTNIATGVKAATVTDIQGGYRLIIFSVATIT